MSGHQEDVSGRVDNRLRHSDRRFHDGRRRHDFMPRATFTKTWIVVLVAVVNGLSLVGEAFVSGWFHASC
ncbi:hypothetical protein QIP36_gp3 [ssRNA phage Gerhypos.1_10]|jgi:hypothetical protein|uniref:Uncharacterized protein n=2 Tax=Leviviricetes TaxID=2842243 RepID=A0A8S5L449_9VIRU|nr:hypothetical protein QIP36_gp3 [ssRNA phage Gerhypos.1_10]QDH89753.1 MAG: hypothetical protein H1Bulk29181_000003 [Leviviridae sp.]DAD52109.1 TPA_asm: hypothetical protein [ssRNA phage Gerhypos.1_10]